MSLIQKTVSIQGTEQDFIQAFVDELKAADNRIVCETDIGEQFSAVSKIPEIVFNINSCYKIKLKRSGGIATRGSSYYINIEINGTTYNSSLSVTHGGISLTYDEIDTRTWKFNIISSDKCIVIWLASYNENIPSKYSLNSISIHTDGFNAAAYSGNTNALSGQFIRTDETDKGAVYTFTDRLNYSLDNHEKVEIIKNKTLINGGCKNMDFDVLWDCSSVAPYSAVTIDGINYYALNNHTLICLENEGE